MRGDADKIILNSKQIHMERHDFKLSNPERCIPHFKEGVTNLCLIKAVSIADEDAFGHLVDKIVSVDDHERISFTKSALILVRLEYEGRDVLLYNPTLISVGQKGL